MSKPLVMAMGKTKTVVTDTAMATAKGSAEIEGADEARAMLGASARTRRGASEAQLRWAGQTSLAADLPSALALSCLGSARLTYALARFVMAGLAVASLAPALRALPGRGYPASPRRCPLAATCCAFSR